MAILLNVHRTVSPAVLLTGIDWQGPRAALNIDVFSQVSRQVFDIAIRMADIYEYLTQVMGVDPKARYEYMIPEGHPGTG